MTPDSDDYYTNPATGPGPVHVLQEELAPGGLLLTACGLEADGVLWNRNGAHFTCQECKACTVETALACDHSQVVHGVLSRGTAPAGQEHVTCKHCGDAVLV